MCGPGPFRSLLLIGAIVVMLGIGMNLGASIARMADEGKNTNKKDKISSEIDNSPNPNLKQEILELEFTEGKDASGAANISGAAVESFTSPDGFVFPATNEGEVESNPLDPEGFTR